MLYSLPLYYLITIISVSILYIIYKTLLTTKYVKLYYESQNFGTLKAGSIILEDNNAALCDFSDTDVLAFQELLMTEGRWNERVKFGIVEEFKAKENTRYGWFAAVSTAPVDIGGKKYIKCFGIYINPNLNFKIADVEEKLSTQKDQFKGSLVVAGRLYDVYNVAFVCVHLIWDPKASNGYDNLENRKLIDDLFEYLRTLKLDYFVVLGDFNIKFSTFKEECIPRWKKLIPHFNSEVDDLQSSLMTCYDTDGYAHPDHIITNLKIDSFRTRLKNTTDHVNIYGSLLVPVPKLKKLVTSAAVNSRNVITEKNR